MNRSYCITSGIIFAFVALAQGWRFVLNLQIQIGAWGVPRSLSGFAAVAAALLAAWAFMSARIDKPVKVAYT